MGWGEHALVVKRTEREQGFVQVGGPRPLMNGCDCKLTGDCGYCGPHNGRKWWCLFPPRYRLPTEDGVRGLLSTEVFGASSQGCWRAAGGDSSSAASVPGRARLTYGPHLLKVVRGAREGAPSLGPSLTVNQSRGTATLAMDTNRSSLAPLSIGGRNSQSPTHPMSR